MRQESFIYAGYIFDVELAKHFIRGNSGLLITPHRTFANQITPLRESVDLLNPIIFATFNHPEDRKEYGALLIDGSHRVKFAVTYGLKISAAFLSPEESYATLGNWIPKWAPRYWRKMILTKNFIVSQIEGKVEK